MAEHAEIIGGKIVEGKEYSLKEIPPNWRNAVYLPYHWVHIPYEHWPAADPVKHADVLKENEIDPQHFRPETFPVIEDFEVILWSNMCKIATTMCSTEYSVNFFSPSLGFIGGPVFYYPQGSEAVIPAFLMQDDFVIPHGSFARPYYNFGQDFAILIAKHDGFVYIVKGNFEEVREKGYAIWYKVETQRYFAQWEKVLQQARRYDGQQQHLRMTLLEQIQDILKIEDKEEQMARFQSLYEIFYWDNLVPEEDVIQMVNLVLQAFFNEKDEHLQTAMMNFIDEAVNYRDIELKINWEPLVAHIPFLPELPLGHIFDILGYAGDLKYIPLLEKYTQHPNPTLRKAASESIERILYSKLNRERREQKAQEEQGEPPKQ